MAQRTRTFELVDRILEGRLADELRSRRAEKPPESFDRIARWLHSEHGIEVTDETVRQWVNALPDDAAEAAAS